MKYRAFLILPAIGLLAVITGWLLESRHQEVPSNAENDFPIEIDYFLKSVSIKVTNDEGNLDYVMRSPYLDHLTGDDISRIKQPDIQIFRSTDNWHVSALNGELFHKLNWLELREHARLERTGDNPVLVTTNRLLFEPDKDIIAASEPLKMLAKNTQIIAEKAIFDMARKVHTLQKTRAVYYQ